jgi:polyisoprenoid-binding protein YceI
MGIPPGTHTFGPENGTLWVKTGRGGAAAAAGHDLLIQVTGWEATLEFGAAETSVVLEVDPRSLRVHEGVGGMQPLGDLDKQEIERTIENEILKGSEIAFRSTAVDTADASRIGVQGELTLGGTARPLEFELAVDDEGAVSGSIVVTQSEWGIELYSTLFGALKVNDEVEIVVNAALGEEATGEDWSPDWAEWKQVPIVDPGVSSFVWALVFFLYLWLGMAAIGIARGTALVYALLASLAIFLYVRTRGMGREES